MQSVLLFPFSEYWWIYAGVLLLVFAALALDLGVFHRKAHAMSFREAAAWSVTWVVLALLFNYGLYRFALWDFAQRPELLSIPGFVVESAAKQVGLEFLTGYLVEEALSVDNIFIFAVVFSYFGIPGQYQHRVLFFGILGALVFRALFIALGAVLLQFHWIIVVFGVFLIITGAKLFFAAEKPIEPEHNPLIKLLRRLMPVTHELEGQRFFLRKNGVLHATPLLVCLVFLEVTDIVFAVDSVPAIFAITHEPLIVFSSNVFAILGLRALFFVLMSVMHRFWCLKYGLGVILVFVGLKMVWLDHAFGGKFPINWSLGIIGSVLAGTVIISLAFPPKKPNPPLPIP